MKPIIHQTRLSAQKGFTLLELLMVMAIVGILASLAVPQFQNSTQRARFTEVVNAVSPYKTAVERCATNLGALNTCNAGTNGIPPAVGAFGNVLNVNVAAGVITATGGTMFDDAGVPTTYILTPTLNGSGLIWNTTNGNCDERGLCNNTN